jgi:hypothetical protein
MALERKADPSAVILDSRTVQSTPESGARAGFDGQGVEGAYRCGYPGPSAGLGRDTSK